MSQPMPRFKRFSRTGARKFLRAGEAAVSLHRKGRFSFNAPAQALFGAMFPKALFVLVDEAGDVIGFEAANVGDPEAYLVSYQTNGSTASISAPAVFHTVPGLSLTESRRYPAHKYGEGVIGFSLKDEFEVTTRPPRAAPTPKKESRQPSLLSAEAAAGD